MRSTRRVQDKRRTNRFDDARPGGRALRPGGPPAGRRARAGDGGGAGRHGVSARALRASTPRRTCASSTFAAGGSRCARGGTSARALARMDPSRMDPSRMDPSRATPPTTRTSRGRTGAGVGVAAARRLFFHRATVTWRRVPTRRRRASRRLPSPCRSARSSSVSRGSWRCSGWTFFLEMFLEMFPETFPRRKPKKPKFFFLPPRVAAPPRALLRLCSRDGVLHPRRDVPARARRLAGHGRRRRNARGERLNGVCATRLDAPRSARGYGNSQSRKSRKSTRRAVRVGGVRVAFGRVRRSDGRVSGTVGPTRVRLAKRSRSEACFFRCVDRENGWFLR